MSCSCRPQWRLRAACDVHIERRELKAQGWFQVVRKSEGSYASKLLGEHADWPAHKIAELPYLQAEEDRLLYVAATRARELLVVSRYTGNHNLKAWGALNDFLAGAKELPVAPVVAPPRVEPLDCSAEAQAEAIASRIAAQDRLLQQSWSITAVTAEAREEDKNATISAISSGSCHRPKGATALILSPAHSS